MTPLHSLLAYLPATLLASGAILDLVGTGGARPDLRRAATWLVGLGAVAAVATFLSGNAATHQPGLRAEEIRASLELHTFFGAVGAFGLTALAGLRVLQRRRGSAPPSWRLAALSVSAAAVAIAVTYTGLSIAHGAS
jgi:uncharacterized membrane protein